MATLLPSLQTFVARPQPLTFSYVHPPTSSRYRKPSDRQFSENVNTKYAAAQDRKVRRLLRGVDNRTELCPWRGKDVANPPHPRSNSSKLASVPRAGAMPAATAPLARP